MIVSNTTFYSTGGFVVSTFISSFILWIQKKWPIPDEYDTQIKDTSQPYVDYRFPRLIWYSLIGMILYLVQLIIAIVAATGSSSSFKSITFIIDKTIFVDGILFGCWIYITILIWISKSYKLPNWWGGILNTHLFFLMIVALNVTVIRFIFDIIWVGNIADLNLSWMTVLPWLLLIFIQLDMVIMLITIPYDLPYLEKRSISTPSSASSTTTTKVFLQPVIPFYNSSLLECFTYSYLEGYMYYVKKCMKSKELVQEDELPGLPYQISAIHALKELNQTRGKSYSLLYRLYSANRKFIFIEYFYAFITSSIYFVTPIIMKTLLEKVEKLTKLDKNQDVELYNQLYIQVVGLIIAQMGLTMAIEIVMGLMRFFGLIFSIRLKQMCNMEIFYKTLRRPTVTSITTTDDTDDGDDEEDDDDNSKKNKKNKKNNDNDNDDSTVAVSTTGNIINLMSTDSKKIGDFAGYMFILWASPYELLIGLYLLYGLLGLSSIVGILVMVLSFPITHYISKLFSRSLDNIMIARDKRGSVVNEVLRGIRQIKFFAWENRWKEKILKLRDDEMNHLYKICICNFVSNATWNGLPILVIIAAFSSFTMLEGKELTPSIAFTSMYLYSLLRFQLTSIPENIIELIRASVSLRRIDAYLQQESIQEPSESDTIHNQSAKIGFENATIEWLSINSTDKKTSSDSQPSSDFSLRNLDIMFPKDELSLVCGPTGSGKTLMLLGLLGEAICTKGSVYFPRIPIATQVSDAFEDNEFNSAMIYPNNSNENNDTWILDHRVAYVSQSSWLQNGTIRENILFGLPYIEDRYHSTLWACGLNPDLEILSDADLTEIGERGITLSGGQKQRIALARAVYSRAKIILMDDVLSAVDAYTAKHLYENCLIGPLMKNRTRILVTHHIQMCIRKSSFILHLDNGQITLSGNPSELRQTKAFNNLIEEEHKLEDNIEIDDTDIENVKEPSHFDTKKKKSINKDDNKNNGTPRVLIEKEFREQGYVKRQLYKYYFLLVGGTFFWICVFLLVIGTKGLDLLSTWWLKEWSSIYETASNDVKYQNLLIVNNTPTLNTLLNHNDDDGSQTNQLRYYLGIYTIINLLCVITSAGQYLIIYIGCLRASKILFVDLLDRVLHAPLRFFDTTPIGRILNRFSSDFDVIDSTIPTDTMMFLTISANLVGIFVAIFIGQPLFIIPILIIGYFTLYYVRLFVDGSRECKRIESTAKSPLFSHFTEALVGIATIRAFGVTQSFLQTMVQKCDNTMRPTYLTNLCNRWINFIFAIISTILIMIAGLIVLFGLGYHIDAGTVGFIFSYTLLFSDNSFWTAYRYRRVEVCYNSVERVVEFTKIEQESTLVTKIAPPNWPSKGGIEFNDLKVKYAPDLDLVLKGVDFKINPGEKVGIVGPTGSGKSTLTLSIFRFLEAVSGKIIIDDIDISTLALDQLRSNLTIIPQDPVLFSGTIRSNMDPFNEFSDASISEALSRMNLIPALNSSASSSASASSLSLSTENQDINQNIFENLNSPISEGGQNISAGQKQLICLAKSLLRRSKVVVMDEATSSVDFNTDRKIQKTIRSEFTDCTILCVAHRLFTVIHYDKILVLDAGKVKEFDSPLNLITNSQSMFYKLCKNSGEFDQLFQAAQQN